MGVSTAYFEWADSYDSKDWERLRKIVAPTLRVSAASRAAIATPEHTTPPYKNSPATFVPYDGGVRPGLPQELAR